MQIPQELTYSVIGIFICNLLVMLTLIFTAIIVVRKLLELIKEVKALLDKTQGLMNTAQSVVANAEEVTRHISGSAASARQIVGSVEQAITPSLSLFAATRTTARSSNLKMKLLGAGLGFAVRYFLSRRGS